MISQVAKPVVLVTRAMSVQESEVQCGPLQEDLPLTFIPWLLGSAGDSCPEQLKVVFQRIISHDSKNAALPFKTIKSREFKWDFPLLTVSSTP